jgi:hypothetical protein
MKSQLFIFFVATILFSCKSETDKAKSIISQMEVINKNAMQYQALVVLYLDSAKNAGKNNNGKALDKYVEYSKKYTKEAESLEKEWNKLKNSLPDKYRSMFSK